MVRSPMTCYGFAMTLAPEDRTGRKRKPSTRATSRRLSKRGEAPRRVVKFGTMKGMISLPDAWNAPISDEELALWEGR